MERLSFTVQIEDPTGLRTDRYLSDVVGLMSRSQIQARISDLNVNGKSAKISRRLVYGDKIEFSISSPSDLKIQAEPIDLDILYEDSSVIVVNKPQGMVVHPAAGNFSGTLVQGLLYHCRGLKDEFINEAIRPGIVHRLDKDTSGIIIAAKTVPTKEYLSQQFRAHDVKKKYYAIVRGREIEKNDIIDFPVGRDPKNRKRFAVNLKQGKPAITEYHRLSSYDRYGFLAIEPITGRTHQIRVHFQSLGSPVLGDPVYSRSDKRFPNASLMLHSAALEIRLPKDGNVRVFRSPLPSRMKTVLRELATGR